MKDFITKFIDEKFVLSGFERENQILKEKVKEWLKWSLIYCVTALIITYGWQGLELLFYGEVQHRVVDDIVGTVLMLSVMLNVIFVRTIVKFIKNK